MPTVTTIKRPSTMNNVVPQENLNQIQRNVLQILSNTLMNSFGPNGSNTCIKLENAYNWYTKDGHDILKNIHFHGVMEESIRDDIETITRHIVKTVGDGTTSAVILANLILNSMHEYLAKNKDKVFPADFIRAFEKVTDELAESIKNSAKECDPDKIYDIAMISSNGNELVAQLLKDIYTEHGMEVFIDVTPGSGVNTAIKTYDGVTLNTGIADPCYITDVAKNEAVVDNPSIYFFMDPIDTKSMMVLFDAILSNNIVGPYNAIMSTGGKTNVKLVPTVIIAPKISRDMSSLMKDTLDVMARLKPGQKLPLLIISDFYQNEMIEDLVKLCGAKPIMKYIDKTVYEEDVKLGRAPTPETVVKFAGTCDSVVADSNKTNFINPSKMLNPDGSRTELYNGLITFLEKDLANAQAIGESANVTGRLKRRLHALKSDLVEIIVGGIDQADREALQALIEDSVLNCRSAAKNGVGYGANYMGLEATFNFATPNLLEKDINDIIYKSYKQLLSILYKDQASVIGLTDPVNDTPQVAVIDMVILHNQPLNIRTGEYDGKVLSSIESDIIILKTVVKIVSMMATCNQYLTPTPIHNVYVD